MPVMSQSIEYNGQFLSPGVIAEITPYIEYGVEHKRTAVETAKLVGYAQKIGKIHTRKVILPATLDYYAAKKGQVFGEFSEIEIGLVSGRKIRSMQNGRTEFSAKEIQLVDQIIKFAFDHKQTVEHVARLLNYGGRLSREVSERYIQNRANSIKRHLKTER